VDLASGEGRFAFRAERLPLLQRSDQWLVLSGEGEVTSGWNFAHLKGRLAADAGFVGLSHTPAPSLGDDVVVQGPAKGGKPAASPFQMSTDLTINLGDALYVRALGLDTRLAGELSLASGPGRPSPRRAPSAPSAACMRATGSGSASSAASSPSAARSPTRAST
jgi:translocation and assembly module TamB